MTASVKRLDYSNPPPGWPTLHSSAWAHYKARNEPPGLRVRPWGLGWVFYCRLIVDPQPGPRTVMVNDDGQPYAIEPEALAAAWGWYDRRLALALRMVLGDFEAGHPLRTDHWPRCLTWSDEQVAEVERWLVDSTAELPEVLRG